MPLRLALVMILLALSPAWGNPDLSGPVERAIAADRAGFLEEASVVILGFGTVQGIDRAGLDQMVAVERAALRAQALRRLAVADLDGHDLITETEVRAVASVASARVRGRALRDFQKADAHGNGRLTRPEALAHATAEADRLIARRGEVILALSSFESDADGFVRVDEVQSAISAPLAKVAGQTRDRGQAPPMPI